MLVEGLGEDIGSHPLGIMAGESLFTNGCFRLSDIDAVYQSPSGAAQTKHIIAGLANDRILVAQFEDDLGPGYRFIEESVAPYIWIRSAKTRFMRDLTHKVAELPTRTVSGLKS
jgi:hypothetical protein